MKSPPLRMLTSIGLVLVAGCQVDPFTGEYARRQPSAASLVGRYAIDPASLVENGVASPLARGARLELRGDGTFTLHDTPDCWLESGCTGRLDTAAGVWKVNKHREHWAIGFSIRTRNGATVDIHTEAMLRAESPPYLIHFTVGDPDAGRALVFAAIEEARSHLRANPPVGPATALANRAVAGSAPPAGRAPRSTS